MSDGLMFTEWKNISMNELNMRDVTVNRSYHIRKPLDKALDHLKIDLERDKTELVNDAIEAYVNATTLPVLGRVSAGSGVLAEESIDHLTLPGWLVNGAQFALHVKGESMEPTLSSGDIVGVHPGKTTRPGDIVVALRAGSEIEEADSEREGVIKRIVMQEHEAYLKGDNPDEEPRSINGFKIVGKVVCILRVVN